MATPISDIIANNFMVLVDDIRLQQELVENSALFFRRAYGYFSNALALLNRPPELWTYLNAGYVAPQFGDYEWTSTDQSLSEGTTVDVGFLNYGLFNCSVLSVNAAGVPTLTPYTKAVYNADQGTVVFPVQTQAGVVYSMDFYQDGVIGQDDPAPLSERVRRLIGLACALVYEERNINAWLPNQNLIESKTFQRQNVSGLMRANAERVSNMRTVFNSELRKYEQDVAYSSAQISPPTAII